MWYLCCFDLTSVYLICTICECSVYQCVYCPFVWSWILLICMFCSGSTDLNLDWYIFSWFWICLPLLWFYDANFARSYALESYWNSCLGSESAAGSYVKPISSDGSFTVFFHADFYDSCKLLVNSFNGNTLAITYVPQAWVGTSFFVIWMLYWRNCWSLFTCSYLWKLIFEPFVGLIMVRGQKGFPLWPKDSPWNDRLGSPNAQFYCCLLAYIVGHLVNVVWLWIWVFPSTFLIDASQPCEGRRQLFVLHLYDASVVCPR